MKKIYDEVEIQMQTEKLKQTQQVLLVSPLFPNHMVITMVQWLECSLPIFKFLGSNL